MGLIDLFKRRKNKPLLLEEGKAKDIPKQEEEKLEVQVFSKKMHDNRIEYSFILNTEEKSVLVGKICRSSEELISKNIKLKNIANKIKEAMNPIAVEKVKSQNLMDKAKKEVKETIQAMADKQGVILAKDVIQYIDRYGDSNSEHPKTDSKQGRMSDEEWKRLQELEEIKTPDDAYAYKDSLISYMKKTEKVPFNPIVEASIKSVQEGKKLDEETVKRIASNMEKLGNEDGLLYSVYLKIEEKRIWKQLQTRLAQYSNNAENEEVVYDVYQLSEVLEDLDKYELPDRKEEFSPSVLEYVMNEMGEKNIENYIENVKEKDTFLARSINTKCPGISNKTDMLQFLYARVASLGQLSYKSASNGNDVLRNFIANTDFKHEDDRETKEFLLMVANIEKEAIQNKYVINLEDYNKTNQSLKERVSVEQTPVINFSERQRISSREEQQETDRTA